MVPLLRAARVLLVATCLVAMVGSTAALAGDVTAKVAGGTLKVKGTDDDDVLVIERASVTPGEVRVTGFDATTVNGAGFEVFPNVTGLKVALGDGADNVTFDLLSLSADLVIATGHGSDRSRVLRSRVDGKMKVDLGAENNAFALCQMDIGETLTIKAGAPIDQLVSIACPDMNAPELMTDFGSAIAIRDVEVHGVVSIKGGKGGDLVGIEVATLHSAVKVQLGGHSNGLGLCDVAIESDLTIGLAKGAEGHSELNCGLGRASASGHGALVLDGVAIDGKLKMKSGAGVDGVVVTGVSVGVDAKLDVGSGPNVVGLQSSTVVGNLTEKGSKGDDDFTWDGVVVGGNATIKLDAGDNRFLSKGSSVDGNLTIKAGKGDDTISTTLGVLVGGTRTIDADGGVNTIN